MNKINFPALLIALMLSAPAAAQTPLSELQFFAIHNSYQRSDPDELLWGSNTNILSMADQLDGYNTWHMEWDLFVYQARWGITDTIPLLLPPEQWELWLGHTVLDGRGASTLDFYLSEIAQTRRLQEGFFLIKFQLTDNLDPAVYPVPPNPINLMVYRGSAPDIVYPTTFESRIRDQILQHVPLASVYTQDDFEADGFVWPTPEQLVRRGKHVAFYFPRRASDDEDPPTPEYLPFFLTQGDRDNDPTAAVWNLGKDDIPGDSRVAMYNTPGNNADVLSEWEEAMGNGHNFVGTTKPGERRFDARFHPPVPTYVEFRPLSCPLILPVCGSGTWLDRDRAEFAGLENNVLARAILRVENWETTTGKRSIVPIRMIGAPAAGPLVFSSSTDYVINTAILLQNDTGADVILK